MDFQLSEDTLNVYFTSLIIGVRADLFSVAFVLDLNLQQGTIGTLFDLDLPVVHTVLPVLVLFCPSVNDEHCGNAHHLLLQQTWSLGQTLGRIRVGELQEFGGRDRQITLVDGDVDHAVLWPQLHEIGSHDS